jgi:hypothetical protein
MKIGFLVIALVIAFGSIGVGYSALSQDLVLNGPVASGNFDTRLVNVTAYPDIHGVATLTVDTSDLTGHTVGITAANLYPGATETITFMVSNSGNVPVKLAAVSYSGVPSWVSITDDIATPPIVAGGTSALCTITITMLDTASNEGILPVGFTFTIPIAQQYGL